MAIVDQQYKEQAQKALLEEKRIREAGFRAKKSEFERLKNAAQELKKSLPPKVLFVEAMTMVGFAFMNDFFDWLLIGSIPILGDILDAGTWFIIIVWAWFRHLKTPPGGFIAGIVEFIPFLDILPVYTAMVIGYLAYNEFRRVLAEREIKKADDLEKEAARLALPEAA